MTDARSAPVFIQQIGTAVPERSLDLEESAQLLQASCINPRSSKLLHRLVKLTGIERRHLAALDYQDGNAGDVFYRPASDQPRGPGMSARTAAFEDAAGPLVLRAISSFSTERLRAVDSLITVSCTHASSPGLEGPIFRSSPMSPSVDRWNLGFMGCSAALAAMRLVHQRAALRRTSLIVACELSSLHFQYTDELDQMTANLLFADGAAAMMLSPEPASARVVDCRCLAVPELADQMVWFAGDNGLRLRLSSDLPESLSAHVPPAVDNFLRSNGLSRERVDHWLVHPGGTQILDAVQQSLRLPVDALRHSREVYRRYGNMSSPTIFFILRNVLESGARGWTVAMAFGPGLTVELVLLQLDS